MRRIGRPNVSHRVALVGLLLAACAPLGVAPSRAQEADPGAGPAPGPVTVAVVALSGYDNVMADVGYVGALMGQPQLGEIANNTIGMFTQGKGLEGLDKTRPWGIVVQAAGMQFSQMVCLPVDDLEKLLAIGEEGFGVTVEDAGNGVTQLTGPQGPPLFVRTVGGWAIAAQQPEALDAAPADPAAELEPLVGGGKADIGIRAFAQNIPPMFKQMAVQQMRQGMEGGLQKQDGESDEDFETRRKGAELQIENMVMFIEQSDEVRVGISVNPEEKGGAVVDVSFTALAGSDLAKQIGGYTPAKSELAGFARYGEAMQLLAASVVSPEVREKALADSEAAFAQMRIMVAKGLEGEAEVDEATRQTLLDAMEEVIDVLKETTKTGKSDVAMSMRLEPGPVGMVMAISVSEPAKLEAALKKVVSIAEGKPDFPPVQWNTAEKGGYAIHTLSLPIPDAEPQAREVFGDAIQVAFGIGESSICMAVGADAVGALGEAIEGAGSAEAPAGSMGDFNLSVGEFLRFASSVAPEESRPMIESVSEVVNAENQGDDHILMTADMVDNGLHYRITTEEGVLKAVGAAVMAFQQQAMAGAAP